jgi:single-strand DNA-binding protein
VTTTITFAGNLTDDAQLGYTREGRPAGTFRVLVNRRTRNEAGEWVDAEPTARNVRVFGTAAAHAHNSLGRGDRVLVHSPVKTDAWPDKESGQKRTRTVVDVNHRFGEVGASLRWAAARIERIPAPAPRAV